MSNNIEKDKYHRAARDGFQDILKEATRKDCNNPDEDGLTPTLWAAYYGHLDVLRLLIGRGGDPDKCDFTGNTALHWSSSNGHINCVSFLVNFGANLWSLNNDFHTAKDCAAVHQKSEILDFLDTTMAKQSALNPKLVQKQKEKAITEAEKRIKAFDKIAKKAHKKAEKEEKSMEKFRKKLLEPISSLPCSLRRDTNTANTGSTYTSHVTPTGVAVVNGSLSSAPKFSDIVNNGTMTNKSRGFGGVSRKVLLRKQQSDSISTACSGDYKSRSGSEPGLKELLLANGKKSIRSLTGLRRGDDVLYVRKYDVINNKINSERSNSSHHIYASIPCKESDSLSLSNGYLDSGKCSEMSNNSINKTNFTNNNNHINHHYHQNNHNHLYQSNGERLYARPALRDLFGSSCDDSSTYCHPRTSDRSFSSSTGFLGFKNNLHRTVSEPDFLSHMADSGLGDEMISCNTIQESSIFERPGFGSVSFRHSLLSASSLLTPYTDTKKSSSINREDQETADSTDNSAKHYHSLEALRAAQSNGEDKPANGSNITANGTGSDSIGSAGSLAQRNATLSVMSGTTGGWDEDGNTLIGDSASSASINNKQRGGGKGGPTIENGSKSVGDNADDPSLLTPTTPPVVLFLAAQGMLEYTEVFQKEKIDLEALALLNENDLKSLGLPLGPRRKLMLAIERRKTTLKEPGLITDTIL
ncbi:Usher syndrome type-1G protein isoform X1 [Tetranychus urticae]|uniref:Usher syndrome type-1G protein isoform X1 n=2 Tax=Tetranychus urticae TaxID=32264 RepID=UPI00077BE21B|nr:Usher syndrome type-1G protein isoform X1 [Tetranychus urticae]